MFNDLKEFNSLETHGQALKLIIFHKNINKIKNHIEIINVYIYNFNTGSEL